MTDEEFFDPFPDPDDEPGEAPEVDLPWMPPVDEVGVDVPLGVDAGAPVSFAQTGGHGGGLRVEQSWWMHPLPDGDVLTVVVRWDHAGVPESSATLDLAALRTAAADSEVLWDPRHHPAPTEGAGSPTRPCRARRSSHAPWSSRARTTMRASDRSGGDTGRVFD